MDTRDVDIDDFSHISIATSFWLNQDEDKHHPDHDSAPEDAQANVELCSSDLEIAFAFLIVSRVIACGR